MPPAKSYNRLGFKVLAWSLLVLISSKFFHGPFESSQFSLFGDSIFKFDFQSQNLQKIVSSNLEGQEGRFAVLIENLGSGENYTLNAYESFPAASLYKLYLLAAVLKEIEVGSLKMEDTVTSSKDYLSQRLGGIDFGYENSSERIVYTIEEALIRVSRISDNFAAIMLSDKIGWEKLQKMADSLGATSTQIHDPITTTAADTGNFFKKLHNKEIVSPAVSDQITKFLSLNQLNNRIPAKLPPEARAIHKTGELPRLRHDGGIVYLQPPHQPYIIVLMSKDIKFEDQTVEVMSKISKEVYDYFTSKGN